MKIIKFENITILIFQWACIYEFIYYIFLTIIYRCLTIPLLCYVNVTIEGPCVSGNACVISTIKGTMWFKNCPAIPLNEIYKIKTQVRHIWMFGKNFDRHKMLGYARLLKSKKNQKHVLSKRRKLSINSIYNWAFNKYAYCVTLATCFHVCVWSKLFENLVARTSRNLFTVKKMLHPKKHFFFSLIFIFIFFFLPARCFY